MEGLDPVKRMEADPNYINAVSIFEKKSFWLSDREMTWIFKFKVEFISLLLFTFTYDPFQILAILLDLQRQAMYGGPFISH